MVSNFCHKPMSISSFEGCQLASNLSQGYEKWGTNASMARRISFQDETVAGLHCPRGGFIVRTSTNAWLKD